MDIEESRILQTINYDIQPLDGGKHDYDWLIDTMGKVSCVLLGESTHGTHEFYREHAHITCSLIEEKGFNAVAVEIDWSDAYRVNCYVKQKCIILKIDKMLGKDLFQA